MESTEEAVKGRPQTDVHVGYCRLAEAGEGAVGLSGPFTGREGGLAGWKKELLLTPALTRVQQGPSLPRAFPLS